MARLITKCKYLKGKQGNVGGYATYIATREGVDRIDTSFLFGEQTKKQEELIKKILRDFPDSKDMHEYEDYVKSPTKGNASEFISRALEDNAGQAMDRKTYADYIATRPRAEKFGSHGLFTDDGIELNLAKVSKELNEYTGNVWTVIKTTVKDFYDIQVGVISGGFVGRHMVKLLQNFHVDVVLYDPILTAEQIAEMGAKKVSLEELLSTSDVISIHAPSIPATENMLNADNLPMIKDGAILINTARGAIINEEALIKELQTGRFFACLDVTTTEPAAKDNPLRNMDNVVLTPHIAGTATNGLRRVALHVCEEIGRLVNGEKMRTEVNLDNLSKLA